MAIVFILISIIVFVQLRGNRYKRRLAEKENENLQLKLKELQNEVYDDKSNLESLLKENNEISDRLQYIITNHLEVLQGMLAKEITKRDDLAEAYDSLVESIHKDKEKFLDLIRENYSVVNPDFLKYLEDKELTESEINFVCLYCLGLRGKEVGQFLGIKGYYNISTKIRKKLGLDSNNTNLRNYILDLFHNPLRSSLEPGDRSRLSLDYIDRGA